MQGKVVIITGASSGIGAASAKLLARKGAKVVLGARREDKLKQLAEEICAEGGEAIYQLLDVTQQADNDAIVQLALSTYGQVDVIFLNAGIMPSAPLSAMKTDDWHEMVDINIKGVLNGVAAVLPTFTAQKSGQVIATSSVAGLKGLSRCRRVWRHQMVCARVHGGLAHRVGDGEDEHPHRHHLPGSHQHRVAQHHQRPGHLGWDARPVRGPRHPA